jgi:DNA-binding MarR family transcriptional regulator
MANECPAFRVRKASRVLAKLYDDELRPFGLQFSQLPVLAAVVHFGERGASMSALAHVVVMDRTTLSRTVKPLERSGLLRVARDPSDARARVVLLTRAGERMIERVYPAWERVLKRIQKEVGTDVLGDLHSGLDHVIAMSSGIELGAASDS